MTQSHSPPAQQVQVAERVTFLDGHRTVAGHVARKGRTYAPVVTDEGTEVRVPYQRLARDPGPPRQQVQSRTDILRAQWHAGDRVHFAVGPRCSKGPWKRNKKVFVHPYPEHLCVQDTRRGNLEGHAWPSRGAGRASRGTR
jgi:hypothetical protein